jgi:hypothetical protein
MTKPRTKAAAAAPPALSLKAISKSTSKSTQSASQTPPTKEKEKIYSADNFPSKQRFLIEFLQKHPKISEFLEEEEMQNFHKLLDELFFKWLNHRQNSQKMVYEIKHEFMSIAEAVLIFEVTNKQRKLTPHGFVIGPFQKILEDFAADIEPGIPEVIPYSRPLRLPLTSTLEDTQRQILEDDMRLAGIEDFVGDDIDDKLSNFDASSFFSYLQ